MLPILTKSDLHPRLHEIQASGQGHRRIITNATPRSGLGWAHIRLAVLPDGPVGNTLVVRIAVGLAVLYALGVRVPESDYDAAFLLVAVG